MRRLLLLVTLLLIGCPKGEESIRKANVFFKNGDLARAEEAYERALEADPESAAALEGLGNVAYEQKKYDLAIERYQQAIAAHPEAISARHKLAVTYSTVNRVAEAIEVLEATVKVEPKNAFAYNALGGLYQKRGDLDVAKEMQIRALGIDEDFHAARFALGSVLVDLGELEAAERELTRLMKKGERSLAEYGYARLAASRGAWADAARHLDVVLDAGVSHPEKIARDPVFTEGWSEGPMRDIKRRVDRIAGSKTSTVPKR